jgi:hypothetical protein
MSKRWWISTLAAPYDAVHHAQACGTLHSHQGTQLMVAHATLPGAQAENAAASNAPFLLACRRQPFLSVICWCTLFEFVQLFLTPPPPKNV